LAASLRSRRLRRRTDAGKLPRPLQDMRGHSGQKALATDPATLASETGYGKFTRAARAAGYKESNAANLGKMAYQLGHDDRIKLAVQELARTRIEHAALLSPSDI
jgi:hypothetical protein